MLYSYHHLLKYFCPAPTKSCLNAAALLFVLKCSCLTPFHWPHLSHMSEDANHSGETRACTRLKLWGVGILTHVAYVGSVERSEAAAIKDKEQGSCI